MNNVKPTGGSYYMPKPQQVPQQPAFQQPFTPQPNAAPFQPTNGAGKQTPALNIGSTEFVFSAAAATNAEPFKFNPNTEDFKFDAAIANAKSFVPPVAEPVPELKVQVPVKTKEELMIEEKMA